MGLPSEWIDLSGSGVTGEVNESVRKGVFEYFAGLLEEGTFRDHVGGLCLPALPTQGALTERALAALDSLEKAAFWFGGTSSLVGNPGSILNGTGLDKMPTVVWLVVWSGLLCRSSPKL